MTCTELYFLPRQRRTDGTVQTDNEPKQTAKATQDTLKAKKWDVLERQSISKEEIQHWVISIVLDFKKSLTAKDFIQVFKKQSLHSDTIYTLN